MVTIHDVARHANVSISTVSNVINNRPKVSSATIERVNKAIEELNFVPNSVARALKISVTNTIGVIVEDLRDFVSMETIDGIYEFCEQNKYHINMTHLRVQQEVNEEEEDPSVTLLNNSKFKTKLSDAIDSFKSAFVSGIIYIGRYPRDLSNCLPKLDIPIVYVYCYAKNPASEKSISISYDDFHGVKLAVDYLIYQGHSKIAIIGGSINTLPTHRRIMGYQQALMEHSLPLRTEYISSGKWTFESGFEQLEKLITLKNMPTAILAMSDIMAFGAISAAKEHGIDVPGDISIHGFDHNSFAEYFIPPLTTVEIPLFEVGREAASSVIKMIEDDYCPEPGEIINLSCRHVERKSVKKIVE